MRVFSCFIDAYKPNKRRTIKESVTVLNNNYVNQKDETFSTEFVKSIPLEKYQELRKSNARSKKSAEAVTTGLENSICIAIVKDSNNNIVGMARLVGDGGLFCAIVNVCVLPNHHNKGLPKMLMKKMMEYISDNIPKTCFVGLVASNKFENFYKEFGFTSEKTFNRVGMFYKV